MVLRERLAAIAEGIVPFSKPEERIIKSIAVGWFAPLARHGTFNDRGFVPFDGIAGIIVGEGPGPSTNWQCPMFPWPNSSAGARLLHASGLDPGEYLARFARVNLLETPTWDPARAAGAADAVAKIADAANVRLILCGTAVLRAFLPGHESPRAPTVVRHASATPASWALPHPSGRNRVWNDRNVWTATAIMFHGLVNRPHVADDIDADKGAG